MAYPQSKTKPIIERVWESIRRRLPGGSDDKKAELQIPSHQLMQKKCLQIYLEKHRKMLCECLLSPELNIVQTANGINVIFEQLRRQKIYKGISHVWNADNLTMVKLIVIII